MSGTAQASLPPHDHPSAGGHTLCIGCGVCVAVCPRRRIHMQFSPGAGIHLPSGGAADCDTVCGLCDRACPFTADTASSEEIARPLFAAPAGVQSDDVLGFHRATLSGFSEAHRETSASGGLLTGLLQSLLRKGAIDGVVCVGPDADSPTLFDFRLCRTEEEIAACAGSCYQPVEISRALQTLRSTPGKFAIVALPCMARALRLAAQSSPALASRITFILGLTCGQLKSRHFVDYLGRKTACPPSPSSISFRHRTAGRPASNFMFRLGWPDGTERKIGWAEVIARPWTERWFTPEACDCCDDVFAECADAVFMDAWLPEHAAETQGRNLVVIRHPALQEHLRSARAAGEFVLDEIAPARVIESQAGVVHQKRALLAFNAASLSSEGAALPRLRLSGASRRPYHRLEAWTKRAVRRATAGGAGRHPRLMECRIGILSLPWRLVQAALRTVWRLKRAIS